ncbi:GNAT family N-acetyltransferase [Methanoregula sp.]|uniref:GNAT family N-acetyltransferase n=1 Tax=Methanoregula sp. TaxID=2052170 RepID=UPI003C76C0AF
MQEIRLQIEKLNKENFDNFIDLHKRYIESERTRYLDTTLINRLKKDAFLTNPKYEAYLGKIGLDWVAYVIIIISYSTFIALPSLSIEEIFVLNNFRNLGIGGALFEFCVRNAKKRGCGKIEISVPNRNEKAKFFFEFNRAIPIDITYYEIDFFDTKIGNPDGKMTYADLLRKRNKSKITKLNSRVNEIVVN